MKQPDQGAQATIAARVTEAVTAAKFAANHGEAFPEVLATPILVGDLERACAKLLEPLLEDGQMSVGAVIEVKHVAPTGVGGAYTCSAIFTGVDGPLYWFDVRAADAVGTIGKGRIARAIVNHKEIVARGDAAVEGQT